MSGLSPEQFYEQWHLLIWAAGALLGLCLLSELFRLKRFYLQAVQALRGPADASRLTHTLCRCSAAVPFRYPLSVASSIR